MEGVYEHALGWLAAIFEAMPCLTYLLSDKLHFLTLEFYLSNKGEKWAELGKYVRGSGDLPALLRDSSVFVTLALRAERPIPLHFRLRTLDVKGDPNDPLEQRSSSRPFSLQCLAHIFRNVLYRCCERGCEKTMAAFNAVVECKPHQ